MVQLYCSEQIKVPETFPNILKDYAKAAIRTQPYDLLRWSAAYFRCLANNVPPPAKIRLEKECRQGSLTKGYLKVLVAQVGKGFFISRCLLQERWKALCLPEDELLKYLSLSRMLNWPQVHWLKLLAVMIGSLNQTPQDTMVMVCELLTDDMEGGLARIPYWMFKICYTFVAKLECSQEQCFVNGQLVLPWGDLEEATQMESLPRILSATLLKDTIITSCKAKFQEIPDRVSMLCPLESPSSTASTEFMINAQLGDPKELLAKCEDFDTILLLLTDQRGKHVTEDDFKGPHFISEKQLQKALKIKEDCREKREEQDDQTEKIAQDHMKDEAFQMLREMGPPWTLLHQFTTHDCNTASYNFIDTKSVLSDATPDVTSVESFDLVKEAPKDSDSQPSDSSSCLDAGTVLEKCSLESLKSLLEEADNQNKCDLERTSSVVSYLKSEELGVLQRAGEPFSPSVNLKDVTNALERAEANGKNFNNISEMIDYIVAAISGNIDDFPPIAEKPLDEVLSTVTVEVAEMSPVNMDKVSMEIPPEWQETIPKQVVVPPKPTVTEEKPEEQKVEEAPPSKEDMTAIFEDTVGIAPEVAAKMPKFCFEKKDADELILGLVTPSDESVVAEEEDYGSVLSTTDVQQTDGEGYRQDVEDMFDETGDERKAKQLDEKAKLKFCCIDAPTLDPKPHSPPPFQYHCSIQPMPGIGAAVSQKTIDEFLAFMQVRARSQRGMIHPKNFKEEKCPYMVDTSSK